MLNLHQNTKIGTGKENTIMMDITQVASYICFRYKAEYGKEIDEMKLHKLLYFAQRECLVQTRKPLFTDRFKAWKYGPVMLGIRQHFKKGELCDIPKIECVAEYQSVFDKVFLTFAPKDSWGLSSLTHNEYSWQKARKGCAPDEHSDNDIATEDIAKDADRIRTRRFLLSKFQDFQKTSIS